MAINIIAKNLYSKINNSYFSTSKKIEETAEKMTIVATKDDLNLISNRKIQIKGNK